MERTLIGDLKNKVGEEVVIKGWVSVRRDQGKMVFFDFRDRSGTVQGVGFRPFVQRTAEGLGIRGWVRNDVQGVLIRAVGREEVVETLVDVIEHQAPRAATVESVEDEVNLDFSAVPEGFTIIASERTDGAVETAVPAARR